MGRPLHPTIAAALVALSACGGESNPPTPTPPSGGGETITGRERMAWIQTVAADQGNVAYRYAVYVDNQRSVLQDVTCMSSSGDTRDCSAPLPALTAGRHTLELAAFFNDGDTEIEGPRSPVLQVNVAGISAPASPEWVEGGAFVSSDGVPLQADILVRDLVNPTDLAAAPDRRIFVAEQSGRIRIIDAAGRMGAEDADNVFTALREPIGDDTMLRSIALARDFSESGQMHVVYTSRDRDRTVLRLRLGHVRERAGRFGQAAVVASHEVPERDLAAVARVGPDGRLYVATGSGADIQDAQNQSAASGKILRLALDGTTPDDNPSRSPILSSGHRDPRGLTWLPDGSLWEVERDAEGDELNGVRPGANYGWPLARRDQSRRGTTPASLILPMGSEPSGLAAVSRPTSAFFGDLIISTLGARDLLRVRFGADGRPRVTGELLQRRFGRIRQVTASVDGELFVVTDNQQEWGPGRELLIRIVETPTTRANR